MVDYNDVPVSYCKNCLGLRIALLTSGKRTVPDIEYCVNCGSADIEECHIEEWEKKYELFYGYKFIEGHQQLED